MERIGTTQKKSTVAWKIIFLSLLVYILVICSYYYRFIYSAYIVPTSFSIAGRTFAFSAYAWNQSLEFKGLMNDTVTNNTFMLFNVAGTLLCPEANNTCPFWMKNTPYGLDIIWVNVSTNGVGQVIYFANATPYNAIQNKLCGYGNSGTSFCPVYTPHMYANYVIETWQGFSGVTGLHDGEEITFNYK